MKQIECKYWANNCFFIDQNTMKDVVQEPPLNPLLAVGLFFCDRKPSLLSTAHREDTTMQMLYKAAKDHTQKESAEKPIASALFDVCNQTNRQFQKLVKVVEAMPDNLVKKRALAYTDDGILYTNTCKRRYFKKTSPCVSPMPAPLELPEAAIQQINTTEINHSSTDLLPGINVPKNDMDYALQFKNSTVPMNWQECYDSGKKDRYFSAYASATSLKRAFYKKNPCDEEE